MVGEQWQEEISRRVVGAQIVVGALTAGCIVFLGIALLLHGGPPPADEEEAVPLFGYVALFVAVAAVAARLVIPAAIMTRSRQQIADGSWQLPEGRRDRAELTAFLGRTGDAGKLWLLFLTRTIIAAAVLEAAAFFSLVAYLIGPSVVNLIVAVLMIVGVAFEFPRRGSVLRWIEDQLRMVDQLRSLGR